MKSVMASQLFTKVDTPEGNGRKRNLSLPSGVSAASVKKAKDGCVHSNGGFALLTVAWTTKVEILQSLRTL